MERAWAMAKATVLVRAKVEVWAIVMAHESVLATAAASAAVRV